MKSCEQMWVHSKLSLAGVDTSQGKQPAEADVLTDHSLKV